MLFTLFSYLTFTSGLCYDLCLLAFASAEAKKKALKDPKAQWKGVGCLNQGTEQKVEGQTLSAGLEVQSMHELEGWRCGVQ